MPGGHPRFMAGSTKPRTNVKTDKLERTLRFMAAACMNCGAPDNTHAFALPGMGDAHVCRPCLIIALSEEVRDAVPLTDGKGKAPVVQRAAPLINRLRTVCNMTGKNDQEVVRTAHAYAKVAARNGEPTVLREALWAARRGLAEVNNGADPDTPRQLVTPILVTAAEHYRKHGPAATGDPVDSAPGKKASKLADKPVEKKRGKKNGKARKRAAA